MRTRRTMITLIALTVAITAGLGTTLAKGKRRPKAEKYFASKDIRLHMPKPKDLVGWKQDKTFDPEKEKSLVYKIVMKKPDSADPFDVRIVCSAYDQKNMNLTITDRNGEEQTVSTASVARIAEIFAGNIEKSFKEIKDKKKLRKQRISATIKKGYYFYATGRAQIPLHHRLYVFGVNGKTYIMQILMTTTSIRDKELVKTVDNMVKKMIAWKP